MPVVRYAKPVKRCCHPQKQIELLTAYSCVSVS